MKNQSWKKKLFQLCCFLSKMPSQLCLKTVLDKCLHSELAPQRGGSCLFTILTWGKQPVVQSPREQQPQWFRTPLSICNGSPPKSLYFYVTFSYPEAASRPTGCLDHRRHLLRYQGLFWLVFWLEVAKLTSLCSKSVFS